uniref:Phlebovirus glycoprotein G2 fusion domain-containing protein n=1 Tax=Panagrolaimus superbus TaxID=310955 RepID=A0A914Z453_9BILA
MEVFQCVEWHIIAAVNVTISTQTTTTTRILTLSEGHSAEVGKVKIALIDANVENTIPSVNQQFIATEKSVALLDEIGVKAAELVKCESSIVAETFMNCTLLADACRCLPADGTVACSCLENKVLLKLLNKNALPLKVHDHWLEPTADKSVIARLSAKPRLQVSVQGLMLRTVIDQNSCKAEMHKLSGCSNCPEGAIASFTCTTDYGNAEAHVLCENSVSFPLKCSQRGYLQNINLFFDTVNVDLNCDVKCPSNTGKVNVHGILHQSVLENPWSTRTAAEVRPTTSFFMPILHALKDFWQQSYLIMIITLVVAGILAIIVLKIIT